MGGMETLSLDGVSNAAAGVLNVQVHDLHAHSVTETQYLIQAETV